MKTEGIKRVFHAWNLIFQEHVEQLTALDSAGGDGDLGVVMRDGFRIADEFVTDSDEHDIGKLWIELCSPAFFQLSYDKIHIQLLSIHSVCSHCIKCICNSNNSGI